MHVVQQYSGCGRLVVVQSQPPVVARDMICDYSDSANLFTAHQLSESKILSCLLIILPVATIAIVWNLIAFNSLYSQLAPAHTFNSLQLTQACVTSCTACTLIAQAFLQVAMAAVLENSNAQTLQTS